MCQRSNDVLLRYFDGSRDVVAGITFAVYQLRKKPGSTKLYSQYTRSASIYSRCIQHHYHVMLTSKLTSHAFLYAIRFHVRLKGVQGLPKLATRL